MAVTSSSMPCSAPALSRAIRRRCCHAQSRRANASRCADPCRRRAERARRRCRRHAGRGRDPGRSHRHLLPPQARAPAACRAASCAAEVVVADIGIPEHVLLEEEHGLLERGYGYLGATLSANAPAVWLSVLPTLTPDAHKYTRGHAVVVSGPPEQHRRGPARRPRCAAGRRRARHRGEPAARRFRSTPRI